MTEKPILFSGPMVRAILEGRKVQTRRVITPQPKVVHAIYPDRSIETNCIFRAGDQRIHPRYPVGTRLWVRETWFSTPDKQSLIWYAADGDFDGVRRPSIFMPRKFSRINLLVTGVRCQRLQAITEEDAVAEGAEPWPFDPEQPMTSGELGAVCPYRGGFAVLWDDINTDRGFTWLSNPWVWAYTFQRILE